MPLTWEKELGELRWKEQAGLQSSQILLEGDMIVPDSKPDLQEILRCKGEIHIRDRRISDERLSFSGEAEISVLYRAKNGEKPLYAMKTALPLEDFLHIDGLEKEMDVTLTAETEHLDCQIINDRKIGVKAVILVKAAAERKKNAQILTGVSAEGLETLTETLKLEQETAALKDRFVVKEELQVSASQPEIGEVLEERVRLTEQEIRPMEGKVLVRGNICIQMLYTDEEGNMGSLTEKIPFSGYLEHEAMDGKTDLSGDLTVDACRLVPAVDADGEVRLIDAEVTVGAVLKGRQMTEQQILLDAYVPQGEILLQKEEILYPVTVAEGKNQFTLRERLAVENGEMPMLRAETVWGDVNLSDVRVLTDAVEAEGVLTAEILYHCADDAAPAAILRRGIPFAQTMELKGTQEGDTASVSLRLEDIDFQMLSEKEGELRAVVTMEAAVKRQETAEVVTEISHREEAEGCAAGAVIYMVQKGDSLWKIAKRYRTTVADIMAVNDIEHPDIIYPGQKLLILRFKREKQ